MQKLVWDRWVTILEVYSSFLMIVFIVRKSNFNLQNHFALTIRMNSLDI